MINALPLILYTIGQPSIKIGLIDGPLILDHSDLEQKNIHLLSGKIQGTCSVSHSRACMHGTQVAGILAAKRSSPFPGICPGCTLLVQPIFGEEMADDPESDSSVLANSIRKVVDAGANIINLSLGLDIENQNLTPDLSAALDYAADRQVLIITAAGNQGTLASTEITRHDWVIPVVAYSEQRIPMQLSNLGRSIGRLGIGGPGDQVPTLGSDGKYIRFSGTSAATPFVAGIAALLWSLFPQMQANQIKSAILQSGKSRRKSVVPPLLDAMASFQYLKNQAS
jgi:subtilisin family serine protease